MFDFVHEKKRVVQFVLALIILPFAFWGVDSYQKSGGDKPLASVNDEKISPAEFDNALRQQQERMRELAGAAFDPTLFDKPEIKHSILEGLVAQRLLSSEARKAGLTITDAQLAEIIAGIGAFQKDGKFDKSQYEKVLSAQNMSPLMFEHRVRQELSSRQMTDAYTQNGFASNSTVDNLIRLNEQQRVVGVAKLDVNSLLNQVKVSDAQIQDYYQKNQNEFQAPERVKVEYVVLASESLQSQVSVEPAEIKKYYDEHQPEFGTQEQRQASHILISLGKQASDADKQAAKVKAEELLSQVQKAPNSFSAVAKQYSQDPGSASNGGDLGMFARGMMVKPFEDAVFSLKVGEIGALVQSDFGFHIIKLTGIKPAKIQPISEVGGVIAQRLKEQKASDKFAELAEKFSNIVYEQSDSLKPAAELVKGSVQQAGWLIKGQIAKGVWTDKAMQAVFSEEVVKNKRNTAAVEVAPNTLLAARAIDYQPASIRPLAEVSIAIEKKLQNQQAIELLTKQGNELLGRLQKGEKVNVAWKPAQSVTRSQADWDVELARLVFKTGADKLPAYVGMTSQKDGYVLVRIDAVKDVTTIEDAKRARYAQQLRQISGEELLQAYLAEAKNHSDISMKSFVTDEKK